MADSFEALLSSLGFPAADAANNLGLIERRLAMGRDDIELAGEEERRQIDAGMEGRGLFRSGERGQRLARQQGGETRRVQQLEIAAAEDLTGQQFQTQRLAAQQQAQDEYEAAMHQLAMQQIGAQNAQTAALAQLSQGPTFSDFYPLPTATTPTAPVPVPAASAPVSRGGGLLWR